MTDHDVQAEDYAPPALTLLGNVHELTQARHIKRFGHSDGFSFFAPVTHASS